jgi:hypothetical protein
MALRMAEYCLRIVRQHGKFARQIVLYVGEAELSMPATLSSDTLQFSYLLLDVRQLDTHLLLASPQIQDNLLAILTSLHDPAGTIRAILTRIADLRGTGSGHRVDPIFVNLKAEASRPINSAGSKSHAYLLRHSG